WGPGPDLSPRRGSGREGRHDRHSEASGRGGQDEEGRGSRVMAESKQVADISAPVVTQTKGSAGSIELPGAIFAEPLRRGLLADVVRMQMAGRRAGTSATKTRGEVSGGGKKPWKQKGT